MKNIFPTKNLSLVIFVYVHKTKTPGTPTFAVRPFGKVALPTLSLLLLSSLFSKKINKNEY